MSEKHIKPTEKPWRPHMDDDEWQQFADQSDDDINISDIPALDEAFWKNAHVIMPATKKPVSIRMDEDVLSWFKGQGKGYQSRINAVLRSYMDAHKEK